MRTRTLPSLYLATAHLSRAAACLFALLWPRGVAGSFYHAWLIGLVHLITLGWISFSVDAVRAAMRGAPNRSDVNL